ncbi:hypothetical protein [Burkholderia ubonensis]|uniref:hypothetical protein n=1 Tax=Burkholderia ubonensis TaxID=101571 RepID=UPI000A9A0AB3|nr:hypothetical protein [Burkholderia ubonensis]
MRIHPQPTFTGALNKLIRATALLTAPAILFGCAAIKQSPDYSDDDKATISGLSEYDYKGKEGIYENTDDIKTRTNIRNEIVSRKKRIYDIEFSKFETELSSVSNSISLGTDLIGLALGGLTATVGGASTKAALGAASVGVLGTNTAINKDLFYQKTISALKSQMEANRLKVELAIQKGLALPDNKYSLYSAYDDLRAYRNAGRLDDAITTITKNADTEKNATSEEIAKVRSVADYEQLKNIQPIQERIKNSLTDSQLLSLVKIMDPLLAKHSQNCAKVDPNSRRLSGNAAAAKSVLLCWIQDDSFATVKQEKWVSAIDQVTK